MFDKTMVPKTIIYATKGKVDIPLDLYLPDGAKRLPILLWFHGGMRFNFKITLKKRIVIITYLRWFATG